MTALQAVDFGMQLENLLERYDTTESPNAKRVLEECIASNLGQMEVLVTRGDMAEEDHLHYQTLVWLVAAKEIHPVVINESQSQKEERIVKRSMRSYARKRELAKTKEARQDIDTEVVMGLRMLTNDFTVYWCYYQELWGEYE